MLSRDHDDNELRSREELMLEDYLHQHPLVMTRLQAAGWWEDRAVDINKQIAFLTELKFQINPIARDVMRNLKGLRIPSVFDTQNRGESKFPVLGLGFDPRAAVINRDRIYKVEELLGLALTPVGTAGSNAVLVSSDGQTFMVEDLSDVVLAFETIGDFLYFAFSKNNTVCHEVFLNK